MEIVLDAREMSTSSGRYVNKLIVGLDKIDHLNNYKLLLKSKDISYWHPTSSNFQMLTCNAKEFTFSEQLNLKGQIKSLSPDLVHFTFPQQPIFYRGKTITTVHDLTTLRFNNPSKNPIVFKIKQKIYGLVIKKAVRKSTNVIVPSEFVKKDLAKFANINPHKIHVTYESADFIKEESRPIEGLENSKFLMYVGRPNPHKNLERLIQAFNNLTSDSSNTGLKLVLAGKKDANYQKIAETASKRGIDGLVFTGHISEGQLRWLYENCLAYVFPSLSEGFGLPGLEAMIHGAPVVSSNATCLPEIYGDAAIYFDPYSVESMTEVINQVISNSDLRSDLIKKGAQQVKKYSWEKMARQTLDLYNKALSEG